MPAGEDNNQQHQAEEPNLPPVSEELEQPNLPPNQPNQPPNQVQNLPVAIAHKQQLNWSYFKPEFSGKPEEDAEEHLLRTNDWMETHNTPDDQKVRGFCLTLMGEATSTSTNSIQNLVVQESNSSMHGDHSNLMKMLTPLTHIYIRSSKWLLY